MSRQTDGYWYSRGGMAAFKRANRDAGLHWFDADTMRFFRSRVGDLLPGDYFISSEKRWDEGRAYTLRRAMPDGNVESCSGFQQYPTRAAALRAYRALYRAECIDAAHRRERGAAYGT